MRRYETDGSSLGSTDFGIDRSVRGVGERLNRTPRRMAGRRERRRLAKRSIRSIRRLRAVR
ncbi:hypothetical protein BRD01_07160 [Halobacteriales archaeon QS_8_65_32]|nr:MAG: hypothetical protein BRD01_07160 [Halobacteriales archaeon QS_8_65_32]